MAAANPQRGQLGFEVDGQLWTLSFTTNALCAVEEAFDLKDIRELEAVLSSNPSLRVIRKLFRLGLTDCHPDMLDSEAGTLMDAIGGLEHSLELIMLALQQAFPEAAANGTGHPPRPARKSGRGTGPCSISTGARPVVAPSNTGA